MSPGKLHRAAWSDGDGVVLCGGSSWSVSESVCSDRSVAVGGKNKSRNKIKNKTIINYGAAAVALERDTTGTKMNEGQDEDEDPDWGGVFV